MKTIKMLCLLIFACTALSAQNFLDPVFSFSTKKDAILTTKKGKEIKGNFRKAKFKKGLFISVTIKNKKGDKVTYAAEDLEHMYLPASGFNNFMTGMSNATDATTWEEDTSLNEEYLKDGYAYFETVRYKIKKKERTAMMQLLNPAYAHKIKVYHNPLASETASFGVAGIKVAGGDAKSYYVKTKDDKIAFRLIKKRYGDEFERMYGDCKDFMTKYKKKDHWSSFEKHVYEHATLCNA